MLKLPNLDTYIHESNLIEGIDNPESDDFGKIAWYYLAVQENLSQHVLERLHLLVTIPQDDLAPENKGRYRRIDVMVGGRLCPAPSLVPHLMNNWLLDMRDWQYKDPIEMHRRYERAHAWLDGNGRTGRLLLFYHELKLGRKPTLFLASEKEDKYYPLFK